MFNGADEIISLHTDMVYYKFISGTTKAWTTAMKLHRVCDPTTNDANKSIKGVISRMIIYSAFLKLGLFKTVIVQTIKICHYIYILNNYLEIVCYSFENNDCMNITIKTVYFLNVVQTHCWQLKDLFSNYIENNWRLKFVSNILFFFQGCTDISIVKWKQRKTNKIMETFSKDHQHSCRGIDQIILS